MPIFKWAVVGWCLILGSFDAKAQDYRLIAKIDTVAKIATVDHLGNLFVVTPKNELMKFGPKGNFLWNYTNKSFGEVSQLDVTDPLRVILYYADFQQIVVLNNTLSEISKYSFNQNPETQVILVSSANNNGFWVYDQNNRELKKLTNNFIDDLKSGNIYQRNGFDMQANFMLTDDQYVYMNDTLAGVRIFDQYGNFMKTAIISPSKEFEVEGNTIYYFLDHRLKTYNYVTFKDGTVDLPKVENIQNALIRFNRLVVLTEKGITLWAIDKN